MEFTRKRKIMNKKKRAIIQKAKDISVSGSLGLALLGGMAVQGCGETEYENAYSKGIHTNIAEVSPNVFKIVDEQVAPEGESKATISFLDGTTRTLTLEEARAVVEAELRRGSLDTTSAEANLIPASPEEAAADSSAQARIDQAIAANTEAAPAGEAQPQNGSQAQTQTRTEHHHHYHGSGLGGVLFWGSMGYFMGRNSATPVNAGYYSNQRAYTRAQSTRTNLRSSVVRRPKNARRGYFNRGHSNSRSRGFGG
jgi:hypothetical protein